MLKKIDCFCLCVGPGRAVYVFCVFLCLPPFKAALGAGVLPLCPLPKNCTPISWALWDHIGILTVVFCARRCPWLPAGLELSSPQKTPLSPTDTVSNDVESACPSVHIPSGPPPLELTGHSKGGKKGSQRTSRALEGNLAAEDFSSKLETFPPNWKLEKPELECCFFNVLIFIFLSILGRPQEMKSSWHGNYKI